MAGKFLRNAGFKWILNGKLFSNSKGRSLGNFPACHVTNHPPVAEEFTPAGFIGENTVAQNVITIKALQTKTPKKKRSLVQ